MNLAGFLSKYMTPFWNIYEKQMGKLLDARIVRLESQFMEMAAGSSGQGLGSTASASGELRNPGHKWQTLQIGITDLCNIVCSHCTRLPAHPGLQGTMSLVNFARYLSCFSPSWFHELLVSDWGEPTIVRSLRGYLYFAKKRGWDNVHFFTNGTSSDKALFEEIISQKLLGRLFVSVEAASPDLYESIRRQPLANFRAFLSTVRTYKDSYKSGMELFFNVVCMKANLQELPAVMELAAEFGVGKVLLVHLSPVVYLQDVKDKLCVPEQHLDSTDRKEVLKVFEKVIATAEAKGIGLGLPEPFPELTGQVVQESGFLHDEKPYRCGEPYRWVQIGQGGDVYPCCQMGKAESMGNLANLDFYSIWNNLKYGRLIDGLAPDGTCRDYCARCNMLAGKNF